ncbi:MAG: hypothetical protein JKY42_00970 [Flavobacteriales bacterium]|nr:hypothetical protein [Flavobacteriales bacterium]
MSNAVYRNFKKTYKVDLLPTSTENYDIGQKVERDFDGLDVDLSTFIDDLKLTRELSNGLVKQLRETTLVKASFPKSELTKQALIKIGGFIPYIGTGFKSGFGMDKVVKMEFSDIWAKQINGDTLREIKRQLNQYRDNNPKDFRRKLAKDLIIESLYYANKVVLLFNNITEKEMKASLEFWNIDFDTKVEAFTDNKVVIKGSQTLPFAANFKTLKDFID